MAPLHWYALTVHRFDGRESTLEDWDIRATSAAEAGVDATDIFARRVVNGFRLRSLQSVRLLQLGRRAGVPVLSPMVDPELLGIPHEQNTQKH